MARRRDGSPVQAGEAPGAQSLGRFLWTAKDDPSGAKKRQINHHNQHVHLQSLLASQTGLSPYLRFGCLSTRLFYHALSDLYRWLLLISMVWYDYGMIGIIAFQRGSSTTPSLISFGPHYIYMWSGNLVRFPDWLRRVSRGTWLHETLLKPPLSSGR